MKSVGRLGNLIAVMAACLLLAGCAFDGHKFQESTRVQAPENLSGSKMCVYSLLDFRESSYGSKTLAEFEKQIVTRFAQVGVTAKVTDFRSSATGSHYSVSNTDALIPIREIVAQGRNDEIAYGAQYRLLILPTMTESTANNFEITWAIIRTGDGHVVWTGRSRVHTDYIWSTDGLYIFNGSNTADHAKYLLDPFFAEIKAKGLTP